MTLKGRDGGVGPHDDPSSRHFVEVVDQYGFAAMMIELGVLAVATFAAIATDEYWTRRAVLDSRQHDADVSGTPKDPG